MTLSNCVDSQHQYFSFRFTPLEILEKILDKAVKKSDFSLKNVGIVYIHHALATSINVIDAMIRLGALPQNIFVLGKKYSECNAVVENIKKYGVYYQTCSEQLGLGQFGYSFTRDINWLWKQVHDSSPEVENILILDHGGYATSFVPAPILRRYKVVGVEKTTAGLIKLSEYGLPPFPLISMATSATKKILESPLIADAITDKLLSLISKKIDMVCGVIGYGAIGKALSEKLLAMGYQVIVYDCNAVSSIALGVNYTHNLSHLIDVSDYIFGCTGQNIIKDLDPILYSEKDKTMISCSSEDKEFLSLLRAIQKEGNTSVVNVLDEVRYTTRKGGVIRILKGGFPVNFDNSGESVPREDIQLTRALVLCSILQATQFFIKGELLGKAGIYALDPSLQAFVATQWLKKQPNGRFSMQTINNFQLPDWILKNSGGECKPCGALQHYISEYNSV
ncbi:NAD(P)-dependent oxidoreductase [Rickettsiella endosymbiont of Dermanyssus gallinae]|uniref:NAD(P)-dependent oxidoreductase n=1 Tax=Rickettsiella endosymbiont of Dermanyssus gallinae TaxID=2856608 RepID=UPI001C529118|nr:NAD(P)-dependent oxidoreductase [Rickettsiella endosymbiont of Dermanyssus gallinae]